MTRKVFLTLIILYSISASSFACSELLSTLMYLQLKPVVESAKLCEGLTQEVNLVFDEVTIGVDKTDTVLLNEFEYCTDGKTSSLRANVFVKCRTSEKALIKLQMQEDIRIEAKIDNQTCKIVEFDASPRGEIGKLIAENSDFLGKTQKSMQENLHQLCEN